MPVEPSPDLGDAWGQLCCQVRDDVTVTDLGDQLVLLDPQNQEMYALDAVGRFIWQALPDGTLADVADALAARYCIEPEAARRDLLDLVRELNAAGLLRLPEGNGSVER